MAGLIVSDSASLFVLIRPSAIICPRFGLIYATKSRFATCVICSGMTGFGCQREAKRPRSLVSESGDCGGSLSWSARARGCGKGGSPSRLVSLGGTR